MNGYETLGIILAGVAVLVYVLWRAFPYLAKKNVDVKGILEKAEDGIDKADSTVTAIDAVAPIPYFAVIDKIFDVARVAVQKAEDLYKIGQLPEDARKESAKQFIEENLSEAKIDVTDDVKKIIDGSIDYAVKFLPKTHEVEEAPVVETPAPVAEQPVVEQKEETPVEATETPAQ